MENKLGLFESLNARHLTPEEVAQRFISPEVFDELVLPTNSIIIGPRGSGKTTLLKMLQIPAIKNWSHVKKDEHLNSITYISAFIPTDITWKEQWSTIDQSAINSQTKQLIKDSVFVTHVIRSILEGVRHCLEIINSSNPRLSELSINLSKDDERKVCELVSDLIKIPCEIPSVEFLEFSLRRRLVDLGALINSIRVNPSGSDYPEYINLPFAETLSGLISIINLVIKRPNQKWAFLFDELEIAPEGIRQKLIRLLRSTYDQNIILKLSISPYSEDFDLFGDPSSPSAENDYKAINLWYSTKEDARPFCKKLFEQVCKRYGVDDATPETILGFSEFDLGNKLNSLSGTAYASNSLLVQRFKSLYKKDSSFREYIQKRGVDLNSIDKMNEEERASKIRKITNIVCVRDTFLRDSGEKSTKRRPSLYTGATSILDITEGNPRLFLGIVSKLIKVYSQKRVQVNASFQAKTILESSDRFRALLGTIAVKVENEEHKNLNELLDDIGNFIYKEVVIKKFSADPPTCFIVDDLTPKNVQNALGKALNAGAIVYMPENPGHALIEDLKKKRFRLSNLLAPHYKIPMLASKARQLSSILKSKYPEPSTPYTKDIFDESN